MSKGKIQWQISVRSNHFKYNVKVNFALFSGKGLLLGIVYQKVPVDPDLIVLRKSVHACALEITLYQDRVGQKSMLCKFQCLPQNRNYRTGNLTQ